MSLGWRLWRNFGRWSLGTRDMTTFLCHHLSSLCHHCVIIVSSLCHRCVIVVASLCHHCSIILSSLCHHSVTFLSSFCHHSVIILSLCVIVSGSCGTSFLRNCTGGHSRPLCGRPGCWLDLCKYYFVFFVFSSFCLEGLYFLGGGGFYVCCLLLCSTFNKIEDKQKHFLLFSYKLVNQTNNYGCVAPQMFRHTVMNDVYRPHGP